jgi:hypothetical protein
MNEARYDDAKHAPFDTTRLDTLLENEGIDVLPPRGTLKKLPTILCVRSFHLRKFVLANRTSRVQEVLNS